MCMYIYRLHKLMHYAFTYSVLIYFIIRLIFIGSVGYCLTFENNFDQLINQ